MGVPPKYGPEVEQKILERLMEGEALKAICRSEGMPSAGAVILWTYPPGEGGRDGFADRYARARQIGYQVLAEELLEIADNGTNDWMEINRQDGSTDEVVNHEHIQRSRVRVDTRKFLLAKMLPKVYGDKGIKGDGDGELVVVVKNAARDRSPSVTETTIKPKNAD